ncbi:FtsK/SpoIIIE family DNA translocase [Chelatococcus asaccharovorans]|uniref:FtsK/SpoIIIE family DNA translocase n=1 Tax=Chelatococcus asaccharovorans TaxID=28210 RepID=UPI00224C6DE7|nr:DNA translocase FtsK 4TM domain-containing protein [Chelatococcus asaccharovorans]CAH1657988.1 DNA translocase FtsK [Chelatococcus asaccharovorans]CAH1684635.1 DNA translocase FtsK [Chelatococcus asaccharovorans]
MRTLRRPSSPTDGLSDALRRFFARRAVEMVGLALLGVAGATALALATWSVDDPSLTHATSQPAVNLLKLPGAITADLAMQVFGLGAIAFLLPVAAWGLGLMTRKALPRLPLKIGLWLLGGAAAAAVASALPSTARWPLPTGLGGVVGDALVFAARGIIPFGGGPERALVALIYAGVAILALTAACGIGLADDHLDSADEDIRDDAADNDDDADGSSEPGWGIISLGAIAHSVMATKAALARRFAAPRTSSRQRDEPALAAAGAPRRAASPYPQYDDVDDGDDPRFATDGDFVPDVLPSRVAPRAPAPKPGRRLAREAQPSFLDSEHYQLPPLGLLAEPKKTLMPVSPEALDQNAALLEGVLTDFGVRGDIVNVRPGPVVTLYELEPAPGTKSSRVISLADDIARSMSAVSARVAVIPGRNAIGIELPNAKRETVFLRELLASEDFEKTKLKLALCLGKTIGGEPVIAELARMPHLLVAGTTGSGKSVAINTMILSLLYRLKPEECRLIMVDPKMLELSVYEGIPHLLTPVVTDPKKAVVALKWAVREMEERYKKMSKVGVRNIDGFNARVAEAKAKGEVITRTVQTGFDKETGEAVYEEELMDLETLPYIVVIVDEMADLMMVAGKEIEGTIQRLAQMARAAGIHVILATQRPSVDVITGTIKANFPTRISFQVTSKIDSRTILGEQGAEQLLGQGDMLYMAGGGRIMRVHGPFVSDNEVEKIVAHLKRQGRPQYLDAVTAGEEDGGEAGGDSAVFDKSSFGAPGGDLYDQAIAIVLQDQKASTSYIQRRLQIGYNRAASLMERMENEGIVGAANHAGKREILMERGDRGLDDDD